MTNSIIPTTSPTGLIPTDLMERAREYARASKSEATLKVYATVWRAYTAWCDRKGLSAMPATPDVIVAYIVEQAERLKPQTIQKHLAAISQVHKMEGLDSPVQTEPVRIVLRGLKRTRGIASSPKKALRVEHIKRMVRILPESKIGIRDKGLLLLGFVAGMRRSEIVALDVSDLTFEPEGLVITIRRSKRDQEGQGRKVAVPRGKHEETCPVRAIQRWLEVSGIQSGPLFLRLDRAGLQNRLSDKSVALIVKRAAAKAGLDPAMFAGHSLRRGFASSASRAGAAERDIARTTGHRSMMVLRGYIEEGTLFENCAARVLDLLTSNPQLLHHKFYKSQSFPAKCKL